MPVVVDASALYAILDRDDADHASCVSALESLRDDELVVSPFALAEADHLALTRLGVDAELGLLRDVAAGAYALAPFDASDIARCVAIVERYADHEIGVSDASTVVLADRLRTRRMFTLDGHFTFLRPLSGGRFDVLPRRR